MTIPIAWVRKRFQSQSEGLFTHLLQRTGLDAGRTHLSRAENTLLMLHSIAALRDEGHALGRRRLPPGFASVGLRVMGSADTLGGGLEALRRYFAVANATLDLEIRADGDVTEVALRATNEDRAQAALLEDIWLAPLNTFMAWHSRARTPVISMATAREDHPSQGGRHFWDDAPVDATDRTALRLPTATLTRSRRATDFDEPLWDALRFSLANDVAPRLDIAGRPIDARTPRRAFMALPHLSERQTRRRIQAAAGASFRDLRAEAVEQRARELLGDVDRAISDIAAELGYREERSFRRFLVKRTGLSPTAIRAESVAEARDHAVFLQIHALTRSMDT